MTIYERIKSLRESKGLTQEDLALKVGYKSRSAINKIEAGIRDINQTQIVAFAKALGTTPGYLMGWEGNEQPAYEPTTIAAHNDGEEWSPEELEDIEMFKELLRKKRERK